MISPLLFLQSEQVAWPYAWYIIGVVLTAFVAAFFGWIFGRPKTLSEIHKSQVEAKKAEIDTVLSVAREFPVLLNQIAVAQRKSLDDERTIHQKDTQIEELQSSLAHCLEAGPCVELKKNILSIMADVEPMILAIERKDLLERFNQMKERLS
jgi:hypothetical protein